jgi:hypothetical protein
VSTLQNYGDKDMRTWYTELDLDEVKYRLFDLWHDGRLQSDDRFDWLDSLDDLYADVLTSTDLLTIDEPTATTNSTETEKGEGSTSTKKGTKQLA